MKPVRSIILKTLSELPAGKPVHVDRLVTLTGLTPVQVKGGMNHMIKDGLPVVAIQPANVWTFTPDPSETESTPTGNRSGELLEVVGHAKSGLILRDESGTLYRAQEME
jgi:hypothetical protein